MFYWSEMLLATLESEPEEKQETDQARRSRPYARQDNTLGDPRPSHLLNYISAFRTSFLFSAMVSRGPASRVIVTQITFCDQARS